MLNWGFSDRKLNKRQAVICCYYPQVDLQLFKGIKFSGQIVTRRDIFSSDEEELSREEKIELAEKILALSDEQLEELARRTKQKMAEKIRREFQGYSNECSFQPLASIRAHRYCDCL
jgi:hypothetical protein